MRKIGRFFLIMICFCLLAGSMADWIPRANAASDMTASDSCVELIKAFEGFSPQPYYDYNQYTVGYGTKCPTEKYFEYTANGIPKKEAEALLREALADVGDTINSKLMDKYHLTLTQQQFDALVSFSFNIGTGWITSDSTLKNAILNNANENDMVYAFGLYCTAGGKYLPGLVTRRLCEANLFLNGGYSNHVSDDFGYVYYDANGGTVTYRVQGFVCGNNSAPVADAVRDGDVFLGWYTELTGGTKVSTLSRGLTGKTLFARWQSSRNTEDQDTDSTTIKVTGDVVNIRSGPGTNYEIIRRSYRNDVLTVSHVTHLTNMKWGKVQNGWICLDYTNYDAVINGTGNADVENNDKPSDEVPLPDNDSGWNDADAEDDVPPDNQNIVSGTVNVNDFLNIRSGPGTPYAAVGFLPGGSKVEILEQKTVGSTVWGRISRGWVCMTYIVTDKPSTDGTSDPGRDQEKAPEQQWAESDSKSESVTIKGKITADALRIRSAAGTTSAIVGFYYQNDDVVVSERVLVGSVYWGKTNKGWISMDYVSPDSSGGEPSQSAGDGRKTIIGDCLRIRKEAGTEHKIVGFLYYGDTVAVLETKDIDGTVWGRVDKGWICMEYVK